ncbi:MAG TPA: LamG-like jellyroll fold domain-containing protein, partial [Verrucomicrobiae bacterium]|nr:LamG-like jellyroll fold domain-containing protein [Verrucomicrobiae bacterium]
TAELWAQVTGGSGHRSPLTSRGDGPQTGYIFYAEPGNTWQFWAGTSEPLGWSILQGPAVQPNAYAHLVGVYDGTNLFFYVNGLLQRQLPVTFAQNLLNPLRIGAGATEGEGNFFFEGTVDEVAIYNKALGEDRILAHYVAGFPLTTPPSITAQPSARFALSGGSTTFSVSATGGLPLNYQWKFNNQNIAGATDRTLTLTNLSSVNVGAYTVVISNTGGTQTSSAATLSIPVASTKNYRDLIKSDGPAAYWRLGESSGEVAKDEVSGQDGAYLNAVTLGVPGAIPKETNTAAHFTTSLSQKIDVPWSESLNTPVFTAEVWARVTGGAGNYRSPLTSRADSPQRGFIFYAEPGNTWQFWSGKGDQTGWDAIAGPAVQLNQWAHLAATYDGTTKRFFVNGQEVGSSTAPYGTNDTSVLRIGGGASEGDGNYFFEGDVDEVAIYNKALSQEQIIIHYLASIKAEAALRITRDQQNLTINWDSGTLQSAADITGPWAPVTGATSPYTVPPNGTRARFYRLLVP